MRGGLDGVTSDIWIVDQNVFDRVAMFNASERGVNSRSRPANIDSNEWIVFPGHCNGIIGEFAPDPICAVELR
jgi:hypothetical protein